MLLREIVLLILLLRPQKPGCISMTPRSPPWGARLFSIAAVGRKGLSPPPPWTAGPGPCAAGFFLDCGFKKPVFDTYRHPGYRIRSPLINTNMSSLPARQQAGRQGGAGVASREVDCNSPEPLGLWVPDVRLVAALEWRGV
jgi:hypothetical protein